MLILVHSCLLGKFPFLSILPFSIQELLIFFFLPFPTGNRLSWQTFVYLFMYLCIINKPWEVGLLLKLPLLALSATETQQMKGFSLALRFH